MRQLDWYYAKRALHRFFEVNGYQREDRGAFTTFTFPSDEARLEAWLNDSALFTIEMIEDGDLIHAFRGFCQMAGYRAQLPSRGGPSLADLYLHLKNYFEETLSGLSRERDEAIAVMQDCLNEAGQLGPWRGR